ncbi:MAG: tripartite tricarboxylate transporter substrate binding protein, partial [Pollutimonas bauzanensis]
APIIDTLSKAALAALESPALQAGYAQDGGEVQKDATPADFAAALKSDVERWGEVVRQSGATAN